MSDVWPQANSHYVLRGRLVLNESMAKHTSWRVGGAAERYYQPADQKDLQALLASLPAEEPLFWLGLGSNLLVRDGGIAGTVIAMSGVLNSLQSLSDTNLLLGVGASCAKVARFCVRHGLAGGEFLAGIPGTIGGALAMNAGAFGAETWQWVKKVYVIDRKGEVHCRQPEAYDIAYRQVVGPEEEWFVAVEMEFSAVDAPSSRPEIKTLLAKRSASQPIGLASCGSVFRNPVGDYAARLIEVSGLKGFCLGGAQVSEKHANFIINQERASAAEIESLIVHVQQVVRQKQGVLLQPEVRMVGVKL
ncbi:MAG: UDP-N-acetylmuramate dehydrogenase [Gammaproteobacteria bacterium]|nr:UDP-N-acetylmuramate dehydrogenase [Gammaproteobacteria bacterium]